MQINRKIEVQMYLQADRMQKEWDVEELTEETGDDNLEVV